MKKKKFEQRKVKVYQRNELLKREQYIKTLQCLDRVVLQNKFTISLQHLPYLKSICLQHNHV